jgi:predicted amidohydrolase
MSRTIRVAAIQLHSRDDLSQNLEQCRHWVQKAKLAGASMVVLPENFAFFGDEVSRCALAEGLGDAAGPIQSTLSGIAQSEGVVVVAGGWPERSSDPHRPYNTLTTYDPTGALVGHYRKIHLFDVELRDGTSYRESATTTAGSSVATSQVLGTTLGLSICYDIRFPELYRRLNDLGAEILCIPAAFTAETGRDHWHLLNRARAVESQCWVIAANQWGNHGKNRQTYGHSMIVDPWGTVIADAMDRPGFVVGDIDLAWLSSIRTRLPALSHRRLDQVEASR